MNNVSIISSLTLQEFSETGQDTDQEQLMHLGKDENFAAEFSLE